MSNQQTPSEFMGCLLAIMVASTLMMGLFGGVDDTLGWIALFIALGWACIVGSRIAGNL